MRFISLLIFSVLLSGCAPFNAEEEREVSVQAPPPVVPEKSKFDELLDFAANMAGMPVGPRSETCRTLLKNQKEHHDPQLQLRLMVGRLYSDNCGEIAKILDGVAAIPANVLSDERMFKLVASYREALKRMVISAKKTNVNVVERKQKNVEKAIDVESAPEPKIVSKEQKGSESSLLRDKLEAIRSMEKQLDEKRDGN
jgi:uncharacterized protein YaaR (DUF327 family)